MPNDFERVINTKKTNWINTNSKWETSAYVKTDVGFKNFIDKLYIMEQIYRYRAELFDPVDAPVLQEDTRQWFWIDVFKYIPYQDDEDRKNWGGTFGPHLDEIDTHLRVRRSGSFPNIQVEMIYGEGVFHTRKPKYLTNDAPESEFSYNYTKATTMQTASTKHKKQATNKWYEIAEEVYYQRLRYHVTEQVYQFAKYATEAGWTKAGRRRWKI